jgi:molybdopterin-guanine dinucleotide biosynthesis protein A
VTEKLAGLILAGGRSSRLGREKAVAIWRGEPLIAHVSRRFAGWEGPAVSAKPGSGAAIWATAKGLSVLQDPEDAPDGPLSGIREGLRWASGRGVDMLAIAPCDTPALPDGVFALLSAQLGPDVAGAVAETPHGLQPLIAIWRVKSALRALEDLMSKGAHPPVRSLITATGAVSVHFEVSSQFINLNRPQDFDIASGHE